MTFPFHKITPDQARKLNRGLLPEERKQLHSMKSGNMLFGTLASKRNARGTTVFSEGDVYTVNRIVFDNFLNIITNLRPAVEAGITYLIPTFEHDDNTSRAIHYSTTAANFSLPELNMQFNERSLIDPTFVRFQGDLLKLYLPHFTNIPIERILEVRHKQSDLFEGFQKYLEQLLHDVDESETETRILSILKDVDMGIRELNGQFESLRKSYSRKNIQMGIGVLCTALAMYVGTKYNQDIANLIASATGGATGMQYLSDGLENSSELEKLSYNKFYLPWMLFSQQSEMILP